MLATAETGTEHAVRQRLAQQELLRAAAFFVKILDRAVAEGEAVEFSRRAAEGGGHVEKLRIVRHLVVSSGCEKKTSIWSVGLRRDWKSTSEASSLISRRVMERDMP